MASFKEYLRSTMAWVAEKEIAFAAALMKHGIESYSGKAFDKLVSEQARNDTAIRSTVAMQQLFAAPQPVM